MKLPSLQDTRRWLDRVQPSGTLLLGGLAVLVGLLSGAGVWVFNEMIALAHAVAFDWLGGLLGQIGPWTIALVPAIGGLAVGLIWQRFVRGERFHGVAGVMEAVALAGGRLQYWLAPAKTVTAALSIGVGASVGPEDPSVQIGANLSSFLGQRLRLSDEWLRTLVAAGAAGGISAAFNAPIAGVFFALEVILGEITSSGLGAIVISAVIAAVFTQSVSGSQPAFRVPEYAFHSAGELPLYLGLGLLAGPIAALYVLSLHTSKDLFDRWRTFPWLKTAAAGLATGVVGLAYPLVLGVGYDAVDQIFAGVNFAALTLVGLMAAKLVLTAVCIGGGFPGGVFAPSLFLGATLGAAYGTIVRQLFPTLLIAPPAYAMVGMAAVLAGAVHAPLTAILLLFEMTQDYRIILPLMFAVIVTMLLSQALQRDSVYTMSLTRKGLRLVRGRDVEVMEGIAVDEVMEQPSVLLKEWDSLADAANLFLNTRHHGLPVVDADGNLVGILTLQDLERARAESESAPRSVGDVCTRDPLTSYPDESIGAAMRKMSTRDIGRLPVVARDDPRRLVGMLRRYDLVRAYDVALTRRAALRHRAHQVHLNAVSGDGVLVTEAVVQKGARCAEKRVREVAWPRDAVLASLRRGRRVLIPHGDTVIHAGDVLVAVAEGEAAEQVRMLCRTPP